MIIDGVFYSPDAYDLHTGRPLTWPESGKRTIFARWYGLQHLFRLPDAGDVPILVAWFQGSGRPVRFVHVPVVRSSCWINMIPAGGLVVVPEGSSSCQCAYNYKTSLALMSDDRYFHYGLGGTDRPGIPGLRVNFGAPGDRADADGQYLVRVSAAGCLRSLPGKSAVRSQGGRAQSADRRARGRAIVQTWGRNPDWIRIADTDKPWLQSCGLEGPMHLVIRPPPGIADAERWRVVLYFCELDEPSVAAGSSTSGYKAKPSCRISMSRKRPAARARRLPDRSLSRTQTPSNWNSHQAAPAIPHPSSAAWLSLPNNPPLRCLGRRG